MLAIIEELIEDAPSADAEPYCKRLSLALICEGFVGRYDKAVAAGDAELAAALEAQYESFIERFGENTKKGRSRDVNVPFGLTYLSVLGCRLRQSDCELTVEVASFIFRKARVLESGDVGFVVILGHFGESCRELTFLHHRDGHLADRGREELREGVVRPAGRKRRRTPS